MKNKERKMKNEEITIHSPHSGHSSFLILHLLCCLLPLLAACGSKGNGHASSETTKPLITVTIEPLRYFTQAIAGEQFEVVSLVPRGASPETYDPTPAQLVDFSHSRAYLRVGYLAFEQAWTDRLQAAAPHLRVFDTGHGIDYLLSPETEDHDAHTGHTHTGPEPHVWTSAANARILAANVFRALVSLDPSQTDFYRSRHDSLLTVINRTDSLCRSLLSRPGASHSFLIYHPSLTYFARDYGLLQLPIEEGGKEPSPARLSRLIEESRSTGARVVFVQPEFDRRHAEMVARQTGARVVSINPLAYDWPAEMLRVAEELVK